MIEIDTIIKEIKQLSRRPTTIPVFYLHNFDHFVPNVFVLLFEIFLQVGESERVHSSSSHSSDEVTGAGVGGMGGGANINNNNKWEALSLVPDRDVEGLVTRSVISSFNIIIIQ